MDPQLRASAEARLEEAARAAGIADPRPAYRERLRQLRQASQDTFDNAIRHYEKHVLPAMVDSDPLHTWIEYGRYLASLEGDGRVVTIDTVGRAADAAGGAPAGLVLFIPEDTATQVWALCQPLAPSDAQQATMRLLVERKLG